MYAQFSVCVGRVCVFVKGHEGEWSACVLCVLCRLFSEFEWKYFKPHPLTFLVRVYDNFVRNFISFCLGSN